MGGGFWDSFVAILRKEFVHISRDRATLVMALAIPIFQLTLFGFIDQTVSDLPTVVVDQDGTRFARRTRSRSPTSRPTRTPRATTSRPVRRAWAS
jgi:hypothetical protein